MSESIFRNPAIIGYLVKRLSEEFPGKQIGKTFMQKMLYLLTREGVVNFNYAMYHYGPYSADVESELHFAENSKIVDVKWVNGAGYHIEATSELDKFKVLLRDSEKQAIDALIVKFGSFNAVDLSLLATAYFQKDNFDTTDEELPNVIHSVKPNYTASYIKGVLEKGGVISSC